MLEKIGRWLEIPFETYLETARSRPPGLGKNPIFSGLQKEMRSLVPIPGDTWVHDIDVLIEPGQKTHQGQRRHAHPEWAVIFYVDPGDPPVPIMVEDEEVLAITPEPGDAVVLSPDVFHWVAPSSSKTHRLSFAMLVQVPGRETRHY